MNSYFIRSQDKSLISRAIVKYKKSNICPLGELLLLWLGIYEMIQVVKTYSVPRKVAVDASMSLYQFLIAVRQVV